MEWTDEGFVISARPHGETGVFAVLFTREHGRHAGIVPGGISSSKRGTLQLGNRVEADWKARVAEQLGTFSLELQEAHAGRLLDDPARLLALQAICALLCAALPEREAHPALFDGTVALMDAMEGDFWAEACVRWELGLLQELGFGLHLDACALTGNTDGLAYVSPRTGRAVCQDAAAPWQERLLPLPGFLRGAGTGGGSEIRNGLRLSGHFLERHVFAALHAPLPEARLRLEEHFARQAA